MILRLKAFERHNFALGWRQFAPQPSRKGQSMIQLKTLCTSATLAAALTLGLTLPAWADKITHTQKAAAPAATATSADAIDFGDDNGEWANDGECDDPRFAGTGAAIELLEADRGHDASDCRAAYQAGTVTLVDGPSPQTQANEVATPAVPAIDFGDDSSQWANDGECDDPRFVGPASATELLDADIAHDATDCQTAFEAGTVAIADGEQMSTPSAIEAIAFGDDASHWANDGECDDPRFAGTGAATQLLAADLGHDATDCRAAYDGGMVTFIGDSATLDTAPALAIDYGDDNGEWSNDGECDDPRFSGSGVATELLEADRGHDATDCRTAVESGNATFLGGDTISPVGAFDYGGDWSKWALDGECDDLRFEGPGTDKKLLTDDVQGDASDCKALEAQGQVSIRTVYTPQYAAGAPYDSAAIDFGDNSSSYADDNQCDDPRFEGPGAASYVLDDDLKHDANDCRTEYEAGTIMLRAGQN